MFFCYGIHLQIYGHDNFHNLKWNQARFYHRSAKGKKSILEKAKMGERPCKTTNIPTELSKILRRTTSESKEPIQKNLKPPEGKEGECQWSQTYK